MVPVGSRPHAVRTAIVLAIRFARTKNVWNASKRGVKATVIVLRLCRLARLPQESARQSASSIPNAHRAKYAPTEYASLVQVLSAFGTKTVARAKYAANKSVSLMPTKNVMATKTAKTNHFVTVQPTIPALGNVRLTVIVEWDAVVLIMLAKCRESVRQMKTVPFQQESATLHNANV